LTDRIKDNIEKAVSLYNKATAVFTQSAYPHEWFRNQAHLASAYLARADLYDTKPEQLENLNTAIALLQEVLATADPDAPTPDYIDAQYQLGKCLSRRHELTKDAADLQKALKAYKIAYEAISPEHYDREKIWQALPETQTILGSRLVRDGEWHKGLELLQAAINQLRPKGDPLALANAYYQMGLTHEVMAHPDEARIYYRDALRLYDRINHKPGLASCHHSLGTLLGSRGYLSKAMAEFDKARSLYQKLDMSEKVAEIDDLYQAAARGKQEFESLGLGVSV
jgi:tetratricopeptide (TPR) repeat protein